VEVAEQGEEDGGAAAAIVLCLGYVFVAFGAMVRFFFLVLEIWWSLGTAGRYPL
jgi:hypothetical protein